MSHQYKRVHTPSQPIVSETIKATFPITSVSHYEASFKQKALSLTIGFRPILDLRVHPAAITHETVLVALEVRAQEEIEVLEVRVECSEAIVTGGGEVPISPFPFSGSLVLTSEQ